MALQDKYINPFTDFGFKKLFGTEINKDLLIDFLNQILPEKHRVKDLSYNASEKLGATNLDRKAIFDLYCTSPTGERFIVEIQKAKQKFFKERSLFYATFPIQDQSKKGTWNFHLAAVYMVGILDFVFDEDKKDQQVRHEIQLKDQHCQVFYDKLTFIYLEMPNFDKTEEQLLSNFDKWMYALKYLPDLQKRPAALQERIFKKLFDAAEIARFKPEEKQQYIAGLKYYRDLSNVIDTSYDEGIAQGRAEGRAEGIVEGIATGMEKAIIDTIIKGHQNGLPIETLSRITGKNPQEISQILKNILE